eukprot:TRINITY_DN2702_c0_g2_i2.p1 TRINITY_DN2702_c0_g2~~TRINITY_DN2702_c0_g2_i2.p1  ORF type:complete len:426 (-),score=107.06 TRINITY_DN2702_c0_g2_i2:546-1823(-)
MPPKKKGKRKGKGKKGGKKKVAEPTVTHRFRSTRPHTAIRMAGNEIQTEFGCGDYSERIDRVRTLSNAIVQSRLDRVHREKLLSVDLSRQRLHTVPDRLRSFTQITSLLLNANKLMNDSLGLISTCIRLRKLVLSDNFITGNLHPSIGLLVELEELYLDGNCINSLPEEIGNCKQLTKINIKGNQLTCLPKSTNQWIHMISFDGSSNEFVDFPESIVSFTSLKNLRMNDNKIKALPEDLSALTDLETFDMMTNQLEIADSLSQLNSLKRINVSKNLLKSLPDFKSLSKLRELHAFKNQITEIPNSIGGCNFLKSITLSSNQITALPDSMCELPHLFEAHFTNNQISHLPSTVHWPNLVHISFLKNPIAEVPDSYGSSLPSLRLIDVRSMKKKESTKISPDLRAQFQMKSIVLRGGAKAKGKRGKR